MGLRASGFVRVPPLRAPAPPPTATAPPRFPRPPASPKKTGLHPALPPCTVCVPGGAPGDGEGEGGGAPGKRALSPGSGYRPLLPQRPERFCRQRRSGSPPKDPSPPEPGFFLRPAKHPPGYRGRLRVSEPHPAHPSELTARCPEPSPSRLRPARHLLSPSRPGLPAGEQGRPPR